jgi:CBS domain-containing protein
MTRTVTAEPTVVARMTRRPISVPAGASFHDIATILSANRIGAVPVVDERGLLAGVVSELDLVRAGLRARQDLSELTAEDLMTRSPVAVAPEVPVSTAACLLGEAGLRRVFVVKHGHLIGVLSRRDLLRGYARDDGDVREQVEQVVRHALASGAVVRAAVEEGVVLLVGRVQWRSALVGIEQLVRAVPGVVEVRNRIGYVWDDRAGRRRP